MNMHIENLGHEVESKSVQVKRLSNLEDGFPQYIILGTPKLNNNEIIELYGVIKHEMRLRRI